jgi:hypothetical protein
MSGVGKLFWRAMAVSFILFWVLDLLTSAVLVRSGFAYLEGNTVVRAFFADPNDTSFLSFIDNQAIYFVPLSFLVVPPFLDRLNKRQTHSQFYVISAVLGMMFALDRLNLGVASNVANLIELARDLPTPASADVYYALWVLFDSGWAAVVAVYLLRKRGS